MSNMKLILESWRDFISEAPDELFQEIGKVLKGRAEDLKITSITRRGNSEVYIRFKTAQDRIDNIPDVKKLLADSGFSLEDRKLRAHSIPVSYASKEGQGTVKIVYKFDIRTRLGLAFEHILAYVLTGDITDKLKRSMDLPRGADERDAQEALSSEKWSPYVERAQVAREAIESELGEITSAFVSGGGGSKADLVLTLKDPANKKVGLSLKLALGGANIYIYNKDLGDGTESQSLIPSPTDDPWWMVGRKRFFNELRNAEVLPPDVEYNPQLTDYDPPDWMLAAKAQYGEIYRNVVSGLFGEIRQILFNSLGSLTLENLADVVEEAHLGKASPNEERMPLYKLTSSSAGATLEEVPQTTPNMVAIEREELTPREMVQVKKRRTGEPTATIFIDIPGMHKVYINSVKFRSNMLAGNKGNLKIKTR